MLEVGQRGSGTGERQGSSEAGLCSSGMAAVIENTSSPVFLVADLVLLRGKLPGHRVFDPITTLLRCRNTIRLRLGS